MIDQAVPPLTFSGGTALFSRRRCAAMVKVLLIPTNEELMIAMDTAGIVSGK